MKIQRCPIIVLDGPDGSGKTTLGQAIAKRYKAHYLHLTYRWKNNMDLYHWAALEFALKKSTHQMVVIDRWWPSELIYANVFRGGSPWKDFHVALDAAAQKHRIMYIGCVPNDRDAYLDHFNRLKNERKEMYDSMAAIYNEYYDMFLDGPGMARREDVGHYDWMKWQERHVDEVASLVGSMSYDRFECNSYTGKNIQTRWISGNLIDPQKVYLFDEPLLKQGRLSFAGMYGTMVDDYREDVKQGIACLINTRAFTASGLDSFIEMHYPFAEIKGNRL